MAHNNTGWKVFTVTMVILAIIALLLAIDIVRLDTRIYNETMERAHRYPQIFHDNSNDNSFVAATATLIENRVTLSGSIEITDEEKAEIYEDDGFVFYDYFDESEDNYESNNLSDIDTALVLEMVEHEVKTSIPTNSSTSRPLADWEIDLACMMVQHEVGNDPTAYPGEDFDLIQKYMARVIINRLGKHGWNNIADVISAPYQFCPIEDLYAFNAYDETTRKNVLSVIENTDGLRSDILYEMSWSSSISLDDAVRRMEKQVGEVHDVVSFTYAKGSDAERILVFACQ